MLLIKSIAPAIVFNMSAITLNGRLNNDILTLAIVLNTGLSNIDFSNLPMLSNTEPSESTTGDNTLPIAVCFIESHNFGNSGKISKAAEIAPPIPGITFAIPPKNLTIPPPAFSNTGPATLEIESNIGETTLDTGLAISEKASDTLGPNASVRPFLILEKIFYPPRETSENNFLTPSTKSLPTSFMFPEKRSFTTLLTVYLTLSTNVFLTSENAIFIGDNKLFDVV